MIPPVRQEGGALGEARWTMDADDLEPRKAIAKPKDLDAMGIDELEDYIADLEAEIARVREKIAAKQSFKSGAEAVFKR